MSLGMALALRWHISGLVPLQIGLIAFYALALTWVMPSMWADPFGVLAKNIPLLVAPLFLLSEEE